jgi:hypothetical protein
MVEVQFASGDLSGRCGTKRQRVAAFGARTAHALAVRLAQLAVVATLADLDVIPCSSAPDGDGHLLVEVDDDLSLVIRPVSTTSKHLKAVLITATIFKGKHQR